jgi:hypothetical protein
MHVWGGFGTDRKLLHVRVGRVEQAAAVSEGHDGDRVRQAVSDEVGAFDRVDRDIDGKAALAKFFADVEHRGFIAFAFPDDDTA